MATKYAYFSSETRLPVRSPAKRCRRVSTDIQFMLDRISKHGATIGVCGTCMDARGITDAELTPGTRRSTLNELAEWTVWADKVIVF